MVGQRSRKKQHVFKNENFSSAKMKTNSVTRFSGKGKSSFYGHVRPPRRVSASADAVNNIFIMKHSIRRLTSSNRFSSTRHNENLQVLRARRCMPLGRNRYSTSVCGLSKTCRLSSARQARGIFGYRSVNEIR